jgi:hypothetical protein
MRNTLICVFLAAGTLLAAEAPKRPASHNSDMQRAIAFERYKDVAAARQARKEARHPSIPKSSADRSADREANAPNAVRDPGPGVDPRK